jgi:hypothetical protein
VRSVGAVAVVVIAALALAGGSSSDERKTDAVLAPRKVDGLTLPARVEGRSVDVATTHGFSSIFWAGVNLGSTIPGRQPGEVAATRRDYDRWLAGIGELGARVIRIYTILRPSFYDALAAYNRAHSAHPLFVIQGVWLPDETEFDATGNAYTPAVTNTFKSEIDDAVAVVHGDAKLPQRPGHAGGTYRSNVSRWLLAYSIGIEWDPYAVQSTDRKNAGLEPYRGRYFTAAANATPFESWLAAMLDHTAADEAARGWSRPLTFTNWLTLDPLHHPYEPLPQEDLVSVDATHIAATHAWPGGFFASFHGRARRLAVPSDGDGFEPSVHAQGSQQMPDVVPDGLSAQMQLLRDLLGARAVAALRPGGASGAPAAGPPPRRTGRSAARRRRRRARRPSAALH